MNDGEFYTQIKNGEEGQEIIKYSFKNGKRVVRLFKSSDFKIKRINRRLRFVVDWFRIYINMLFSTETTL